MTYTFQPRGVCSRAMSVEVDDQGVIRDLQVVGGCNGNLQGISALVKGMKAYSDRELLARLIQCEAGGEGDTGMKAVAGVVMNRVHARGGEYARVGRGSIRNIIFQPYQFVCASETERGAYNPQNIFNMRPEQIHFDIADWAIAGNRIPDVAESLWFYNPFGPQCRSRFPSEVGYWQTRIGDHCFYNPTDAYYKT